MTATERHRSFRVMYAHLLEASLGSLIAITVTCSQAKASEEKMSRSMTLGNVSILLDGTERQLPPDAVSSSLIVTRPSGALTLTAILNGLIGRDGMAYGFAQAKAAVPLIDQAGVMIAPTTGFAFSASSRLPRLWNVVLSTDISEAGSSVSGYEGTLTYQANFTAGSGVTEIFIPLSEFKPIIHGKVVAGEKGPGDSGYPSRFLSPRALGFQVTRQSVASGRTNLDPIEADLNIKDALVSWGNLER